MAVLNPICCSVGGDPKVILLVTFVDWAKKIFCDERDVTDIWTDRLDCKNSNLDYSIFKIQVTPWDRHLLIEIII